MTPVETETIEEVGEVSSRGENRAPRVLLWIASASFVAWLLCSYAIRDFVTQFLQLFHKFLR